MSTPALADGALLRDIAAAAGGDGFCLWWLGQSGFLVKWQGKYLLFHPYLSESLTKKYADTDTLICATHFPSPSMSHFVSEGDAFRWRYVAD